MGDGGAILHHCAEVTKHAKAILGLLPKGDEHGQAAALFLQEAITHCKRVADMGDKADSGASLNPVTKARAAAREAMKHLSAMKDPARSSALKTPRAGHWHSPSRPCANVRRLIRRLAHLASKASST